MATLHIQAPDGKTLNINVPEGTPQEHYDKIVDDVMKDYKAHMDPRYLEGKMADGSHEYPDTWQTAYQPAADLYLTADAAMNVPGMVRGGIAAVKSIPKVVKAAGTLAEDFSGGIAKAGAKVGEVAKGAWNSMTNNTPRGFGFAQGAGATPEARAAAKEAIEFANSAHPEVGELVQGAARRPIATPPPMEGALPTAEKGMVTAEDAAGMPKPGEAPTDLPQPNVDAFNDPIRKGIMSGPEEMLEAATAQRNVVGKAIENTLAKYDASGTFYDPTSFNSKVKSMLERDAAGNVMTTGWQGEVNEAIKKAAASINDYAVNGPIHWSDAARIKSGMQNGAEYGVRGLKHAEEAYKQVASLLKTDIDDQAILMLQKHGGNVADYQALRQNYGKLDTLYDSLNVAAKRNFANSPIPWWVKMGAGAAIGSTGFGVVKGLLGQ